MGMTVEQIAAGIVAREGGFVNDPDDPGGATNHGVTIGTLRGLRRDIDRDGDVDVADVRALTRAQAVEIYIEHYFHRPRIAELPQMLHATVFDMQVNAGSNAIKILQRLVSRMGFKTGDDGMIGPGTLSAVRGAAAAAPKFLPDAYGIARRNYYYALGDMRPASRKFARRKDGGKGGWITRAEEFIAPRYHLTDAQHRERTATWA